MDMDMDMDAKENVFSQSLHIHITLSLMNFAPNDKQDETYSEAPMTHLNFSPSLNGLKCYTYFWFFVISREKITFSSVLKLQWAIHSFIDFIWFKLFFDITHEMLAKMITSGESIRKKERETYHLFRIITLCMKNHRARSFREKILNFKRCTYPICGH